MARKKKVDTFDFGTMKKYIEDNEAFVKEQYPDFKAALAYATELNSVLPETWEMRSRRADFEAIRKMMESDPSYQPNLYTERSVYGLIQRYDAVSNTKLNEMFFDWYAKNEHFIPVYQSCKNNRWISYEFNGKTYNAAEGAANGWDLRPPNFQSFCAALRQSEALRYMELNRELNFEEGDIVFLRKPYSGNWHYDPYPENDRNETRFGTVLSLTEETKGWRSRKGSRYISVLWMGSPNQKKQVPVKCLKLSARAGRTSSK